MTTTIRKPRRSFYQILAGGILQIIGWKIVGEFPDLPKYVLVGAPHTSNWDFPVFILWMFASGVRLHWLGKDTLFESPLRSLYYRLGGIPVARDRSTNLVDQIVAVFERSEELVIAVAPEGTRSKSPYWKSGFYYMALGAGVPISLGFIDYGHKQIGNGPLLNPSGDIQADFVILREFYSDKRGLHPEKQGAIELRPEE
jgi:1-acyl-sn-glycerol-3-phosphate acyltransferase